ncbi:facilitated trehalose transporter Tret1-like [Trichogramma pretiosum]|uniref:facilitated trehalose transporter Tret1-like n=1 Tax=Trichogramma pretiosum TaxID=7493 RepID=UPI0006C93C92|nr:facilitated trehalose transporter Tret1-like [Trichogramma pretiosum]
MFPNYKNYEISCKNVQFVAAFTSCLNMMAIGAIMGWMSPTLPKLKASPALADNPLMRPISSEEGSWISSLMPLGTMFGSFGMGYIAERWGHKKVLLASTLPFVLGWILVGTAGDIAQIYVGRFVQGSSMAMTFGVLPIYIGEISQSSNRGGTSILIEILLSCGMIYSYSIGPYVSYRLLCLLCACLHLVFFAAFACMPESPHYLLSKGLKEEATRTFAKLHDKSIDEVRDDIIKMQFEMQQNRDMSSSMKWRDLARDGFNRRVILVTAILVSLQHLSGIDILSYYIEDIFRSAGLNDSAVYIIVAKVIQMFGTVLSPVVVDRFGRKSLLIVSSLGCGLATVTFGAYFYLKSVEYDVTGLRTMPIAGLVVFNVFFGIGWGPIPWTILGEMFAPAIKPKATAVCTFTMRSVSFFALKIFTNVSAALGQYAIFFFFSFCSMASVVFILVYIPETKGKTFFEIQNKLQSKNGAAKNSTTL